MEQSVDFIVARANAWLTLMSTPRMICVVAFLLLLLTVDLARRGWRLSWSRRAVNGVFATLTIFHINVLFVPLVWMASEEIKALYALAGIPSVPTTFWAAVPIWLLAPFAVLAHDFVDYWNHRILHLKWLWPIHAVHHSDPDVNGLTAYRVHMLEGLVMWGSYTILLTWLGIPADAIGVGAILLALHNIYVHIDADWGHGPLRMVIASPRFHRWHHADVVEAYGKNLANVFPFYDWMFGTYRVPGRCDAPLGAQGVPQNDVVQLTLFPLVEWTRMWAGARCPALEGEAVGRPGPLGRTGQGQPGGLERTGIFSCFKGCGAAQCCRMNVSGPRSTRWPNVIRCRPPALPSAPASTRPPSTSPSASRPTAGRAGPRRNRCPRSSRRPARRWTSSCFWSKASRYADIGRCRTRTRRVPLLGFAQAGAGGFFDDAGFPVGQGWDLIELPVAAPATAPMRCRCRAIPCCRSTATATC